MNRFDAGSIREHARGEWHDILSRLGIRVSTNPKQHGPCPTCGGKDRFRFDDKEGRGTWYCNQCKPHSGDGLRLVMNVRGCSFPQALELVAGVLGLAGRARAKTGRPQVSRRSTPPEGTLGEDLFRYDDEAGRPVLFVKRVDLPDGRKRFTQWGPTADGQGWQNNIQHVPKPRPMYDVTEILNSPTMDPVVSHEGEKCLHAAKRAGLPGIHTTTVGGASNPRQTDFAPLKGRDVIIVPDNDEAGESYAQTVARLATEAGARRVCLIRLPGIPEKGDIVDWLGAGGTAEQFSELVAQAEPWAPGAGVRPESVRSAHIDAKNIDGGPIKSLADEFYEIPTSLGTRVACYTYFRAGCIGP